MKTLTIIAIICFMLIGTAAIAELRDGLILYFPFEDGSGTTVKDDSGNGYDGTILDDNKVEWTAGKFGGALNFSGQGFGDKDKSERTGRIEVQHDLGTHDALSFSLWFFATRDDDWNYFGDFRPTGSWFARDASNNIILNGQGGVPGGEYPRDEWVHLVVLADSASTTYYINGEEAGNKGGAAARNISTSLHVGCRFSKNEAFLSMIDDFVIWDRIISDQEIEQSGQGPIIAQAVSVAGKLSTTWASIKNTR
jgi:hypothetical protein